MNIDEVPQHATSSLAGHHKRVYARDGDGRYCAVLTSGWDVEEVVLEQAIAEFELACRDARERVERGLSSPLEYHMYRNRMDLALLSQCTGFFKWQVRRHLRPAVFARLSDRQLQRYLAAFNLNADELRSLPDGPP
ncbi:MAG: hypothetical protein ACK5HY_02870 [Parahaliea sp.]